MARTKSKKRTNTSIRNKLKSKKSNQATQKKVTKQSKKIIRGLQESAKGKKPHKHAAAHQHKKSDAGLSQPDPDVDLQIPGAAGVKPNREERNEKIKGLQNVIPLFRNYPHADLLIAGTGEYETELRRLASGIQNVVFLGALPQAKLQAFYRHAIAVLVPSICYEVFGIIIIEAHLQRTPVIVSALGGLKEVTEESGGGFTYETEAELLAAMERLRTDPALRSEMGERGYRKSVERWTEEAHLAMYLRVLEQTAQKKLGNVPWQQPQRTTLAKSE